MKQIMCWKIREKMWGAQGVREEVRGQVERSKGAAEVVRIRDKALVAANTLRDSNTNIKVGSVYRAPRAVNVKALNGSWF